MSAAPYASLNLGAHVADDAAAVQGNRRRLHAAARLPAEPAWLTQVHGIAVADLDATDLHAVESKGLTADAAVTGRPGRVCAVLTADCLPVLLASDDGAAVAAVHAGWRGLAGGVIESALAVMRTKAAPHATIRAWLGPAISAAHFEVGEDVRAAFLSQDAGAGIAFTPNARDRWQCDLYLLARRRLQARGVTSMSGGGHCTYTDEGRFYSHRRDVQHRGLAATGRMATLIWRT
jgi:YfiH family protein